MTPLALVFSHPLFFDGRLERQICMIMIPQIKCKLARRAVLSRLRAGQSEIFAEFTLSIALKLPNLVLKLCLEM